MATRRKKDAVISYQGEQPTGSLIMEWVIPEFEKHERNRNWYIIGGILGGILFIYAIMTINFLFAVILILGAITIFMSDRQHPRQFAFKITDRGIIIGPKFHPYKEVKRFWIIYEPPEVKKLYLSIENLLQNDVSIPLHDQNPLEIRDLLLDFVSEDLDKESESTLDVLRRMLKL